MDDVSNQQPCVTRTYRTAIRLGEDFITLEETITLPVAASDADIQQAVDLGWRIYTTQREALERQIAGIRESHAGGLTPITIRDPDAPASEKQRNYIAALQEDLTWTSEQIASYAGDQGLDLVTMTKGQASGFIDNLKKLAEERSQYQTSSRTQTSAGGDEGVITERQHRALLKLATERGLDLEQEIRQRFGSASTAISSAEASTLLTEWQRGGRTASHRRTQSQVATVDESDAQG